MKERSSFDYLSRFLLCLKDQIQTALVVNYRLRSTVKTLRNIKHPSSRSPTALDYNFHHNLFTCSRLHVNIQQEYSSIVCWESILSQNKAQSNTSNCSWNHCLGTRYIYLFFRNFFLTFSYLFRCIKEYYFVTN